VPAYGNVGVAAGIVGAHAAIRRQCECPPDQRLRQADLRQRDRIDVDLDRQREAAALFALDLRPRRQCTHRLTQHTDGVGFDTGCVEAAGEESQRVPVDRQAVDIGEGATRVRQHDAAGTQPTRQQTLRLQHANRHVAVGDDRRHFVDDDAGAKGRKAENADRHGKQDHQNAGAITGNPCNPLGDVRQHEHGPGSYPVFLQGSRSNDL
jgi:hypothetical protein